MLRNETIPSCGKVHWEGTDLIPVFLLVVPVYLSLSFSWSSFLVVAKMQEKCSSDINFLVHVSQLRIHLVY